MQESQGICPCQFLETFWKSFRDSKGEFPTGIHLMGRENAVKRSAEQVDTEPSWGPAPTAESPGSAIWHSVSVHVSWNPRSAFLNRNLKRFCNSWSADHPEKHVYRLLYEKLSEKPGIFKWEKLSCLQIFKAFSCFGEKKFKTLFFEILRDWKREDGLQM